MLGIPKEKLIILSAVFVDVVGFGIVIPVLPFYVESFGATPKMITLLFSVYALCSFLSAPLLGSISDKIGRRPVFIASVLSTSVGWFVFASAPNLIFLFLGRIIDGLAAGNISTAQSYLVDIAKDDKERTTNIGLIGAMVGIGLIVGPLLGGIFSSISSTLPFWITGILALLNVIMAIFLLPESKRNLDADKTLSFNPLLPLLKAVRNQGLRGYFLAWLFFLISVSGMQAIFALYIKDVFGLGAFASGIFMTGMGAIIAFNQSVALRRFWLKKFKEPSLLLGGLLACGLGFILLSIKLFAVFLLGLVFLAFSQSLLRVVMLSQIAGGADENAKGEVLGITASVTSVSMIIGPLVAGWLFEIQITLPFIASIGFVALAYLVLHKFLRVVKIHELGKETIQSN